MLRQCLRHTCQHYPNQQIRNWDIAMCRAVIRKGHSTGSGLSEATGNDGDTNIRAPMAQLTPYSISEFGMPAGGTSSALREQQLASLRTPSPPYTPGLSKMRDANSSSSSSSSFSSVSAALYRSKLEHIAVRSKTLERLMHTRKQMAAARAKEADLEMRALQFGLS